MRNKTCRFEEMARVARAARGGGGSDDVGGVGGVDGRPADDRRTTGGRPAARQGLVGRLLRISQIRSAFTGQIEVSAGAIFLNRCKGLTGSEGPRAGGDARGGHIANPQLCALRFGRTVFAAQGLIGNTSILLISRDVYPDSHSIGLSYLSESM